MERTVVATQRDWDEHGWPMVGWGLVGSGIAIEAQPPLALVYSGVTNDFSVLVSGGIAATYDGSNSDPVDLYLVSNGFSIKAGGPRKFLPFSAVGPGDYRGGRWTRAGDGQYRVELGETALRNVKVVRHGEIDKTRLTKASFLQQLLANALPH